MNNSKKMHRGKARGTAKAMKAASGAGAPTGMAPPMPESTDAFREKVTFVAELVSTHERTDTMVRYQIGMQVREVMLDETKYGSHGVERLAEAVDLNADTLYDYAKVAAAWTPEKILVLVRPMPNGRRLTFSHLIAVAAVREEDRALVLQEAIAGSLSVRALERVVRTRAGLSKPPGPGDASNVEACIESQIARATRALLSFGNAVLKPLEQVAPTEQLRATLEQVIETQDRFLGALEEQKRATCEQLLRVAELLDAGRRLLPRAERVGAAE